MGLLSRAVQFWGTVNPDFARDRAKARFETEQFNAAARLVKDFSAHEGARRGGEHSDWIASEGSPNADTIEDLHTLRPRSRDHERNSGKAHGIFQTLTTEVIGRGIRPQARLNESRLGLSERKARNLERDMETIWERWVQHADASERHSFYGLQRAAYWNKKVNGDLIVLIQMAERVWSDLDLCLMFVESDRLETPYYAQEKDGRDIIGGVELGAKYGEPVAYWVAKRHPGDDWTVSGDKKDDYTRIPARDSSGRKIVLHDYDANRPGQVRGVPSLSPVLSEFRMLEKYRAAELMAARVAACLALIVKGDSLNTGRGLTDSAGNPIQAMQPGMIANLQNDSEVTTVNPLRPGSSYEPFIRDLERSIGASQGLGYELTIKDFTGSNYSSVRAALMVARRFFTIEQQVEVDALYQPVWEWVIEEAYLRGLLNIPRFYENKREWLSSVQWVPDGWDWVDPQKEVDAAVMAIKEGLSSHAEEIARRNGGDWEATIRQRAVEEVRFRESGLKDMVQEAQVDKALSEIGLNLSATDLYGRFGRKKPAEAGDTVKKPVAAAPKTGGSNARTN